MNYTYHDKIPTKLLKIFHTGISKLLMVAKYFQPYTNVQYITAFKYLLLGNVNNFLNKYGLKLSSYSCNIMYRNSHLCNTIS